ncbi:5'-methylthioadenosine/adenosylhomocysteine nucleosidase [Marinivivus vitaminiproducens]|uniref:5'-methylthioadenosine/adenosylhomocysteine nucleosidase n=1 Tax=Marinivivus vitaminiproducens TaxID=3035935 RepID=UPI00279DE8C2|nr:5'-methylthioadenosine/adenosylhomocysteine nucleosidase [Geminicoccaceae bacterium SCSIO 64248]
MTEDPTTTKARPVGIICAIPAELASLRAALTDVATEEQAKLRFDIGRLAGIPVVLAEAGIGKVNTSVVATVLALRFDARAIVFSGVAGGLDPTLHVGDVVVGVRTLQHDFGVITAGAFSAYHAGHVPFFNPTDRFGFDVPAALKNRVATALEGLELPALSAAAGGTGRRPRIMLGTILSGDQFINCEATRERLHRTFGGHAVEMEGGALAQVCERFDLPWLNVRSLSDLAGAESHFDFKAYLHEVAPAAAAVLVRLLPAL